MDVKSIKPYGISANYDVDDLEFCNVVYMCIKNIHNSEYHIPDNFKNIVESVISDVYGISEYLYENDHRYYCYLTIKKRYVAPMGYGNREGWHIDGFESDQHNFIWSDSEHMPTEVCVGNFNLSQDHNKSLSEMDEQARYKGRIQLNANMLYEMDQQCVHRPSVNLSQEYVLRTFIKITYSKELFNGIGNAWNYKLPQFKPNKPRMPNRNHTVL